METTWLSARQAAKVLGVTENTVRRRAKKGEFPSRTDNKGVLEFEIPIETEQTVATVKTASEVSMEAVNVTPIDTTTEALSEISLDTTAETTNETSSEAVREEIPEESEEEPANTFCDTPVEALVDKISELLIELPAEAVTNTSEEEIIETAIVDPIEAMIETVRDATNEIEDAVKTEVPIEPEIESSLDEPSDALEAPVDVENNTTVESSKREADSPDNLGPFDITAWQRADAVTRALSCAENTTDPIFLSTELLEGLIDDAGHVLYLTHATELDELAQAASELLSVISAYMLSEADDDVQAMSVAAKKLLTCAQSIDYDKDILDQRAADTEGKTAAFDPGLLDSSLPFDPSRPIRIDPANLDPNKALDLEALQKTQTDNAAAEEQPANDLSAPMTIDPSMLDPNASLPIGEEEEVAETTSDAVSDLAAPMTIDPSMLDPNASLPIGEEEAASANDDNAASALSAPMTIDPSLLDPNASLPIGDEEAAAQSDDSEANSLAAPATLSPEMLAELQAQPMPVDVSPAALEAETEDEGGWETNPLNIEEDQIESLQFFAVDIQALAEQLRSLAESLNASSAEDSSAAILELATPILQTANSFGFKSLIELTQILLRVGERLTEIHPELFAEVNVRLSGIASLADQFAGALQVGLEQTWPLKKLGDRLDILISGRPLHPELMGWHENDTDRVLELDGASMSFDELPKPATDYDPDRAQLVSFGGSSSGDGNGNARQDNANAVIRVELNKLTELSDLAGQLALVKNRVARISQSLATQGPSEILTSELSDAANDLAQLSGSIQIGVMKTQVVPLPKVLERYPRVLRDVARISDKEAELIIENVDFDIDRKISDLINELMQPLIRFMVESCVDTTASRTERGLDKNVAVYLNARRTDTSIELSLTHNGSKFDLIQLVDAAEKAEVTLDESDMEDNDALLTAWSSRIDPGLVSLQPRLKEDGSSMKLGLDDEQRLKVDIQIPLTSAIVSSMMFLVDDQPYCLPLSEVQEVIKPKAEDLSTVNMHPVLRLRGEVVPLLNLRDVFGLGEYNLQESVVLVLRRADRHFGVVADQILGPQEIVVKPINGANAPDIFRGACIHDDGSVALVLHSQQLCDQGIEFSQYKAAA